MMRLRQQTGNRESSIINNETQSKLTVASPLLSVSLMIWPVWVCLVLRWRWGSRRRAACHPGGAALKPDHRGQYLAEKAFRTKRKKGVLRRKKQNLSNSCGCLESAKIGYFITFPIISSSKRRFFFLYFSKIFPPYRVAAPQLSRVGLVASCK